MCIPAQVQCLRAGVRISPCKARWCYSGWLVCVSFPGTAHLGRAREGDRSYLPAGRVVLVVLCGGVRSWSFRDILLLSFRDPLRWFQAIAGVLFMPGRASERTLPARDKRPRAVAVGR